MIDNLFDVDCNNVHMVKVDSFEAAEPPVAVNPIVPVSQKQLNFLKSLFAERQNNETAMIIREHLLSEYKAGKLSVKMASEAISEILEIPKDEQKLQFPTVNAQHGEVWVTTGGAYVRIKESNSTGRLYGLVWVDGDWSYDFARETNAMSHLDHKITAEEAAAWGHEHQWCVFCSRPLSDPRSEFAGYGEVCARKHMLPWGEVAEPIQEDVIERPYGDGICRICRQPRPYFVNGSLRGCNC